MMIVTSKVYLRPLVKGAWPEDSDTTCINFPFFTSRSAALEGIRNSTEKFYECIQLIETTFLYLSRAEGRLEFVLCTPRIGALSHSAPILSPTKFAPETSSSKALYDIYAIGDYPPIFVGLTTSTIMPGDCFMSSYIHSKQCWMDH